MKKVIGIVLSLILVFSMTACGDKTKGATDLAKIGETVINSTELDEYVALLAYVQGVDMTQMPAENLDIIKASMLGNMVELEAMKQYYDGKDILPETATVDLKKFIDESKATAEVKAFLDENKISDKTLTTFFYSQFYTEEFYKEVEAEVPTLEADAKKYYEDNKETYKAEEVRASHILFVEADKAKAEEVLAQIKGGADFAEMAKQYGTDGTKDTGGDLGYFAKGAMVAEFETAAFAMEKGEVSDLVKTQHGWHIIKLTDKREYKPYTDVEAAIKNELTTPTFDKKINKLKEDVGVKYLTDMKPEATTTK